MSYGKNELIVIRDLAKKTAEIAALPIQKKRIKQWTDLNSLKQTKPMIWTNEIPWHEFSEDFSELHCKTEDSFLTSVELFLRRQLFQWEHFQGDMVVEPSIYCEKCYWHTGYGLPVNTESTSSSGMNSHRFIPQLKSIDDVEKIQIPDVFYDETQTDSIFNAYNDVFHGILEVVPSFNHTMWFSPWDLIIMWTGIEEGLTAMYDNPEMLHAAIDKLVSAEIHVIDEYERLGVLTLNNRNHRIGSGAYGYCNDLPGETYDKSHVKLRDRWGFSTSQIFSEISPAMHNEFAVEYEKKYLSRFGLAYYGCCEPLDKKIDILSSIKNLRKVSMSAWTDPDLAASAIGQKYVYSYKPNPSLLADSVWQPDIVKTSLEKVMNTAMNHGCCIEVILKDISTINCDFNRLNEWHTIAEGLAAIYE